MFKLELKTCPSVIAEVSGDAISANLTCHIFKISRGSMPPDPPRSPETFPLRFAARKNILAFVLHQSLFRLDPPLGRIGTNLTFALT